MALPGRIRESIDPAKGGEAGAEKQGACSTFGKRQLQIRL